jgi:predicted Zn-dependent protease
VDVIHESSKLHVEAWSDYDKYVRCLTSAAELLQAAYESGDHRTLLVNNYAAVLLDLHRDDEALNLLQRYEPEFSQYCSNYAIAIAKAAYDITLIRKWNMAAPEYPKGAILAYMDWQAL